MKILLLITWSVFLLSRFAIGAEDPHAVPASFEFNGVTYDIAPEPGKDGYNENGFGARLRKNPRDYVERSKTFLDSELIIRIQPSNIETYTHAFFNFEFGGSTALPIGYKKALYFRPSFAKGTLEVEFTRMIPEVERMSIFIDSAHYYSSGMRIREDEVQYGFQIITKTRIYTLSFFARTLNELKDKRNTQGQALKKAFRKFVLLNL